MRRIKIPPGVVVFVAIWLAALCVPSVRQLRHSLVLYRQPEPGRPSVLQKLVGGLARKFPDDATVAGWAAEIAPYDPNAAGQDRKAVRKLVTRFPDDLATRALWMRASAGLFGQVEIARKSDNQARLRMWTDAAQIARESANAEPDNAFWPWMEAGFEFGTGNDSAGYAAFLRLVDCTRYNDYLQQTNKARFEFLLRHRHLTWEEKIIVSNFVSYAHWAVLYGASNFAWKRALELKRASNARGAIALENALLNATRLRRLGSDSLLNALISENIARKSLEKFLEIPQPREQGQTANGSWVWVDPTVHGAELARGWAAYVRHNGQPKLASGGAFVGEASVSQEFSPHSDVYDFAQFGMPPPWGAIAVAGPVVLLTLAVTIFAGAAFWLLSVAVRWRGTTPSRGQAVSCAHFSLWLLLGICAVGLVKLSIFFNPTISWSGSEMTPTWIALDWLVLAVGCWLLPAWFVVWKRGRHWTRAKPDNPRALPLFWNRARKVAWTIGLLAVALVYSNGRGLWDGTLFQLPLVLGLSVLALTLALALELARWNGAGTRVTYRKSGEQTAPSAKLRWIAALLWLVAVVGLCAWVRGLILGDIFFDQFFLALLVVLALVGALGVGWKAARDHFGWQLAQRSLGVLVLLWSLTFLGLAIGLMPLRAQLNRNLDRQIRVGEIAWMREQVAKTK